MTNDSRDTTDKALKTLQLNGSRYRIEVRQGRLVNVNNPQDVIRLQNLEDHLLSLVCRGDDKVTSECLKIAATVDKVFLRPVGATTNTLLKAINANAPSPMPEAKRIVRRRDRDRDR